MKEAIEEDKKDHPECHYSTSIMSSVKILNNERYQERIEKDNSSLPNQEPCGNKDYKETISGDKIIQSEDEEFIDPFNELKNRGFLLVTPSPLPHSFSLVYDRSNQSRNIFYENGK